MDDLTPKAIAEHLLDSDNYHLMKIGRAYLSLLEERDRLEVENAFITSQATEEIATLRRMIQKLEAEK